jgi:aminopeptidase
MDQINLRKYADLLVKMGINIQKDQILVVNTPIECAEFARIISEVAYQAGAREVVLNWRDELASKIRYMQAPDEVFDEYPEWQKRFYLDYSHKGAAFLSISASDPELMKEVDSNRMVRQQKVASAALKDYRERMMSNRTVWCVASVPTASWAKKVFPGMTEKKAIEKLWDAIFYTVRADQADPIQAWENHKLDLKKSMDFLNKANFKKLHYHNDLGTNLEIELPLNHIWLGGSEFTPEGIEFIANMPTEEVFTLPKKTGVNGIVYSSKPLNHNGNLIDEFSITFKEGRIVDYTAKKGYDTLKSLIDTDEGSHYLGEVALVPFESPISQSNILFYNTLYDENASCHLAIGEAYPVCVKNGENMSEEELELAGVNTSITHVDFMFGTKDLNITGTTQDGLEIAVFKDGNFAF